MAKLDIASITNTDTLTARILLEDKEYAAREEKRKQFHQKLRAAFPKLWRSDAAYQAKGREPDYWAMPTTDPGWDDLIWKTSENLSNLIEQITGIFPVDKLPMASQVKEKFGTLRFNCDGCWNEYPEEFSKSFHKIVSDAANESETICEDCSKPGKVRWNTPHNPTEKLSTIKCRCDFCWIRDALKVAEYAHKNKRTKDNDKDYYAKRVQELNKMLENLEK